MAVCLLWMQEAAGSNPASRTTCRSGGTADAADLGSVFWEFESPFLYKRNSAVQGVARLFEAQKVPFRFRSVPQKKMQKQRLMKINFTAQNSCAYQSESL